MISVLVAHLNVDHNLPAQGDIASFSFQWSGLISKKKKKLQQLSDPCDCHKKTLWIGESTARGPIIALRVRPISRLMLEMFSLKAHTHTHTHTNKTIKSLNFN